MARRQPRSFQPRSNAGPCRDVVSRLGGCGPGACFCLRSRSQPHTPQQDVPTQPRCACLAACRPPAVCAPGHPLSRRAAARPARRSAAGPLRAEQHRGGERGWAGRVPLPGRPWGPAAPRVGTGPCPGGAGGAQVPARKPPGAFQPPATLALGAALQRPLGPRRCSDGPGRPRIACWRGARGSWHAPRLVGPCPRALPPSRQPQAAGSREASPGQPAPWALDARPAPPAPPPPARQLPAPAGARRQPTPAPHGCVTLLRCIPLPSRR